MPEPALLPGLVSASFRPLSWREVLSQVVKAELVGIEWAGNAHVPHGDLHTAREVGQACAEAGVACPTYGSYYRAGAEQAENPSFEEVVETAKVLGAPMIRVWPGRARHDELDDRGRQEVYEDLWRISELAARGGLEVACEYHVGTLTETMDGAEALLREVTHPAFGTLWQAAVFQDEAYWMESMNRVKPRLRHLHVYHWSSYDERHALREGRAVWTRLLQNAAEAGRTRYAMLEFVKGDRIEQLVEDAAVLREIISGL